MKKQNKTPIIIVSPMSFGVSDDTANQSRTNLKSPVSNRRPKQLFQESDKSKDRKRTNLDVPLSNVNNPVLNMEAEPSHGKFTVRVEYRRKRSPRLRPLEHKETNLLNIADADDLENRLLDISLMAKREAVTNLVPEDESKEAIFLRKERSLKIINKLEEPNYCIKGLDFGNDYSKVFAKKLKKNYLLHTLILPNNKIGSEGAESILNEVTDQVTNIDLSYNTIGNGGICKLSELLCKKRYIIQDLNLEGNKLGDHLVSILFNALSRNKSLERLNLSKNFLTDDCTVAISECLQINDSLLELYLHWNQIRGPGGAHIFSGLNDNQKLRVLDLSCNSLGSGNCMVFAESAAHYLEGRDLALRGLLHLDLSHNRIPAEETKVLANGLLTNTGLFGLHYEGNAGHLDEMGFLIVDYSKTRLPLGTDKTKRIKGVQPQIMMKADLNKEINEYLGTTIISRIEKPLNCWICQSWREVDFFFKFNERLLNPGKNKSQAPKVFLHLDFEKYRPHFMQRLLNGNKYELRRFCPPKVLYFFFTVNGKILISSEHEQVLVKNPTIKYFVPGSDEPVGSVIPTLNYLIGDVDSNLFDKNYDTKSKLTPRSGNNKEESKKLDVPKSWSLENSIFHMFPCDSSQESIDKSFSILWERANFKEFISEYGELIELKNLLKSLYPDIRDSFKYYSISQFDGENWKISYDYFADILAKTSLITINFTLERLTAFLRKPKEDQILITGKAQSISSLMIARRATRILSGRLSDPNSQVQAQPGLNYEDYFKIFVYLARELHIKEYHNIPQALNKVLEKGGIVVLNQVPRGMRWRESTFWNEKFESAIKPQLARLHALYSKYSKKSTHKFQDLELSNLDFQGFMSMLEDGQLLAHYGVGHEDFKGAFRMSLAMSEYDLVADLRWDEKKSINLFTEKLDQMKSPKNNDLEMKKSILKEAIHNTTVFTKKIPPGGFLGFYEFLEALARIAEKMEVKQHDGSMQRLTHISKFELLVENLFSARG